MLEFSFLSYKSCFLLTFLHILGLLRQAVEGVDQVKDNTEKTTRKVEEGVNETQGKDISLSYLRRFIE